MLNNKITSSNFELLIQNKTDGQIDIQTYNLWQLQNNKYKITTATTTRKSEKFYKNQTERENIYTSTLYISIGKKVLHMFVHI